MKARLIHLFLLVLCSCSLASASEGGKKGKAPFLFILFAQSGECDSSSLTLHHVSPSVTYIGDLPKRSLGILPTENFFKFWDHKLHGKEAGILFSRDGEDIETRVLFSNPRYDSELDTLDVRITPLEDQQLPRGDVTGVIFFIEGFATMGVLK